MFLLSLTTYAFYPTSSPPVSCSNYLTSARSLGARWPSQPALPDFSPYLPSPFQFPLTCPKQGKDRTRKWSEQGIDQANRTKQARNKLQRTPYSIIAWANQCQLQHSAPYHRMTMTRRATIQKSRSRHLIRPPILLFLALHCTALANTKHHLVGIVGFGH